MKRKFSEDDDFVSRSQKKRDSKALQDIGERVAELAPGHWKKLQDEGVISADLVDALKHWNRLTENEAKRRHRQYIGKLMRGEDADAITEALGYITEPHKKATGQLHELESLRDRLVMSDPADTGDILSEICERVPEADRQRLGQMARNARKEREQNKPPKNYREVFRYLKELDGAERRLTGTDEQE